MTVKTWLAFKPDRKKYLGKLMSFINFKAIPLDTLASIVTLDEEIKCHSECFQMVVNAVKYHSNACTQSLDETYEPKGMASIVIIGTGCSAEGKVYTGKDPTAMFTCRKPDVLTEEGIDWHKTFLAYKIARGSIKLVKVNNFMYLFGID